MKHTLLCAFIPLSLMAGNLSELVELSTKNKAMEASRYTLDATKSQKEALFQSYLPSITLGGAQTFNQEESPSYADKVTSGYAKLSFTLYDGGKREALLSAYDAQIKNAFFLTQATQNELSLQVTYAYYYVLSMRANLEALEQKLEQLRAEEFRLKKFLSVGTTTEDALLRISASVEQATVEKLQLLDAVHKSLNTLSYLTNHTAMVEEGSTLKLEENANKKEERFDILALEQNTQVLKAQAEASKSAHWPTITLDDTYSRFNNDYSNKAFDTGADRQNTLSLNVQWKIFDFGSTSSAYEANYKNYLSKTSELEYTKAQAKASLNNAQNSYKTALAKATSNEARLNASTKTYELIKKKFQNGIVDNVAYLDALSEKFTAQSMLHASEYDVEYQKAVVLYEMGKEIKGYIQ